MQDFILGCSGDRCTCFRCSFYISIHLVHLVIITGWHFFDHLPFANYYTSIRPGKRVNSLKQILTSTRFNLYWLIVDSGQETCPCERLHNDANLVLLIHKSPRSPSPFQPSALPPPPPPCRIISYFKLRVLIRVEYVYLCSNGH